MRREFPLHADAAAAFYSLMRYCEQRSQATEDNLQPL